MAPDSESSLSSCPASPSSFKSQTKLAEDLLAPAPSLCAICKMPTRLVCRTCKSASYCSTGCQDKDGPLHNLLCKELDVFLTAEPTPADTLETQHKLALLFPAAEKWPKLAWIQIKIGPQTYMKSDLKHESYDVSQHVALVDGAPLAELGEIKERVQCSSNFCN